MSRIGPLTRLTVAPEKIPQLSDRRGDALAGPGEARHREAVHDLSHAGACRRTVPWSMEMITSTTIVAT